MTLRRSLIALTGLLTLTACIGGGVKAPAHLLTITATAQRAVDTTGVANQGEAILIATPIVPRLLATTRLPVINAPTGIGYLKDAAWVDAPAVLFQQVLIDTVSATSGRVVLTTKQGAGIAGQRLGGELTMFGLDARTGEAVITFDAVLTGRADGRLLTRRFQHRAPASLSDPVGAAVELGRGSNVIAGQVAEWIAGN